MCNKLEVDWFVTDLLVTFYIYLDRIHGDRSECLDVNFLNNLEYL